MKKAGAAFVGLALLAVPISTAHSSEVLAPALHSVRAAGVGDSIYFVMTDRFNDGNRKNNLAGQADFRLTSGYDPTDAGFYHGGDLVGLTEKLDYIQGLGFNSIWITPPVKQKYVQGSSAAYHGYWGLDFTTIDPHFGTEAEFQNLISKAHQRGMKIIVDIVVNHTADVIQYDSKGKAYIPQGQGKLKAPVFLNSLSNYHNKGDSTFTGPSVFTGDFYGLDDLFTEKPAVVKGWTDLWSGWIAKYKFDGFRIDTARHVNPEFWKSFLPSILAVAKKSGVPAFTVFGEIADSNPEDVAPFVTEQKFPSALDFPFQAQASNFAKSFNHGADLAAFFNTDDLYTTASTNAYGLTTFMGNHDMGRIGYQIEKAAGWDGPEVVLERTKLANALLMYLRGVPSLYYGDEKGMAGTGGDKAARQDMFSTQVLDWQSEDRIGGPAISSASSFGVRNPLEDQVTSLNSIRATIPAIRSGLQQVRYGAGNLFAVSRFAGDYEYLAVFNSSDKTESAAIPVSTISTWSRVDGADGQAKPQGQSIDVTLPPHGYLLLKADSLFKPLTPLSVAINPIMTDSNSQGWMPITAKVPGSDFTSVTFSYRPSGGKWIVIGTSDHRTFGLNQYQVYLHQYALRKGQPVELVAAAKSATGEVKYSPIRKWVVTH